MWYSAYGVGWPSDSFVTGRGGPIGRAQVSHMMGLEFYSWLSQTDYLCWCLAFLGMGKNWLAQYQDNVIEWVSGHGAVDLISQCGHTIKLPCLRSHNSVPVLTALDAYPILMRTLNARSQTPQYPDYTTPKHGDLWKAYFLRLPKHVLCDGSFCVYIEWWDSSYHKWFCVGITFKI